MKNLAIIPARSGSKGLKNKNVLHLAGKPLLAYSIEVALQSLMFDNIIVSTDSENYAEIARKYGADVPFMRDAEASSDMASSWDVVREVLHKYEKYGQTFDTVMLLQPTSPFRSTSDVVNAFDLFIQKTADAVVSVTEVEHPVQWCFSLPDDGSMSYFSQSPYHNMRRQDLTVFYRENGAIYLVKANLIVNPEWDLYQKNCFAYKMSSEGSLDIDQKADFQFAEWLIQKQTEDAH